MIYIDGFNLLYKFRKTEELMELNKLSRARNLFLEYLKYYISKKKKKILVVFDGKKEPGIDITSEYYGTIKVIYSLERSADEVIKEIIRKDKNRASNMVVSSDREIINYAKLYGIRVKKSEDFAKEVENILKTRNIKPEKEENPILTPKEVDFWLRLFSERKK
jgi:predicted RNA-binding protein with PIN domain